MNAKDRKKSTQVIHREYTDPQGNLHTEYRDSHGNIQSEEEHRQDMRELRTDKNISKGVLIGVTVTCVAGLTAGTIYFLTRLNNPQPVSVINVPTYESTPAPSPPPQQVPVVEQPIVVVPVPQAQSPGSTENTTVRPSASNPPSKQGSSNGAKPSQNSGASVPKPTGVSPPNGNVTSPNLTKTDSNLKNEILKQFQNNLPNNQLIVEVKNGRVTVSGTVATPEQLQQIQPLLKSIPGIGKVDMTATVASKGVNE